MNDALDVQRGLSTVEVAVVLGCGVALGGAPGPSIPLPPDCWGNPRSSADGAAKHGTSWADRTKPRTGRYDDEKKSIIQRSKRMCG